MVPVFSSPLRQKIKLWFVLSATVGLLFASPAMHAALLDWAEYAYSAGDPETWANGDQSGTFENVDSTSVSIGASVNAPNGGVSYTGNGSYPQVSSNQIYTGSPPNNGGLQLDLQFDTRWTGNLYSRSLSGASQVEVTVTFNHWVNGVSFSIYDIDRSISQEDPPYYNFVDTVSHISANSKNGTVSANVTYGSAIGEVTNGGQTYYYGNQPVHDNTTSPGAGEVAWENGILNIDFGNNWISSFTFTYSGYTPYSFSPLTPASRQYSSDLAEPSRRQAIAIGDISFTPVPEVGTVAGFGCFLVGVFCFERRRRRLSRDS